MAKKRVIEGLTSVFKDLASFSLPPQHISLSFLGWLLHGRKLAATAPGLTCPHNHIPSRRRADLLLISSLLGTKTLPGLSSRVPLPFIVKTGNQQMFSIKGQIVNNLGVGLCSIIILCMWLFFFFTTFQNVNTILSSWSRTICMPNVYRPPTKGELTYCNLALTNHPKLVFQKHLPELGSTCHCQEQSNSTCPAGKTGCWFLHSQEPLQSWGLLLPS